MLSSRTTAAPAASASSSWARSSTSTSRPWTWPSAPRTAATAAATPPAARTWLSLIIAASNRPKRCGRPPPWTTASLLEGAQARRRLAGRRDARLGALGLGDEARRRRRHAREAADEVQAGALEGEDGAGRAGETGEHVAGGEALAVVASRSARRCCSSTRRAASSKGRRPESTPPSRATTRARASPVKTAPGEVAVAGEVLGEGAPRASRAARAARSSCHLRRSFAHHLARCGPAGAA